MAPFARRWMMDTRKARVLSVFERACNLLNERGEVLAVVSPEVGDGPFHAVLATPIPFTDYVHVHSEVRVSGGRLDAGELIVEFARPRPWEPRPDWRAMHEASQELVPRLVSLAAWTRSEEVGNAASSAHFASSVNAMLSGAAKALAEALALGDVDACAQSAERLAGLGGGSTPAGDDLIIGASFAGRIIHHRARADELVAAITASAAPLTTTLSAAWLRAAGRAEAGAAWHTLFETLPAGDEATTRTALRAILETGATSGADALRGFFGVIEAHAAAGIRPVAMAQP